MRWLVLGFIFCSSAVMAKIQVEADTFLWQIKKEGAPVSYLVGTIHIGKKGAVLPERLQKHLSESKVLILESDIPVGTDTMQPSEEEIEMAQRMMDPDNRLPELLGSGYVNKIGRCSLMQGSEGDLLYLKPWAAAMICSYILSDDLSMDFGVDYLLAEQAKKSGIRVLPLESYQEMLSYFEYVPEEHAIKLLKLSLDHYQGIGKLNQDLVEDYAQNRFGKIIAEEFDEKETLRLFAKEDRAFWSDWFYNELLTKRNKKWMPALVKALNQEPALIGVGAAHLPGENGVINLLRKEGFSVTPVL